MPVTVITGKEMRRLESEAFAGGADPLIAMEHAAEGVARHLFLMVPSPRALVVCGQGNNGADGLAAARLIRAGGGDCEAVLLGEMKTDEGRRNLNFLRYLGIPVTDVFPEDPAALGFNCVVDALWGTGFSGAPRGKGGEWIGRINRSGLPVLSVDMPSGMDADTGMCCGDCVHADKTVTFHAPKAGLYFSPVSDFCGERVCWDIGFRHTERGTEALTEDDLDRLLPPPPSSLHKGRAGRVLVLAGSPGKAGAAAMCALGALRAGAGLVTVACPEEVMPVLQTLVPNAMCVPRDEVLSAAPAFDVLAAGCGMGLTRDAREILVALLSRAEKAVLDADALTLLAEEPFPLPERCVLTPHVGEGARLLSADVSAVMNDLKGSAEKIAQKYRASVLLKSAASVISDGNASFLNIVGSPAMAKGGSGDALCGVAAATFHTVPDPVSCARLAALRLGAAGKAGAARFGVRSMLTGEMLSCLR